MIRNVVGYVPAILLVGGYVCFGDAGRPIEELDDGLGEPALVDTDVTQCEPASEVASPKVDPMAEPTSCMT